MDKLISVLRITAFLTFVVYVILRISQKDFFISDNDYVAYLALVPAFCFLASFLLKITPSFLKYLKNE